MAHTTNPQEWADLRSSLYRALDSQPGRFVGIVRQPSSDSFTRKPIQQLRPKRIQRKRCARADERNCRAIPKQRLQSFMHTSIARYRKDLLKLPHNKDRIALQA